MKADKLRRCLPVAALVLSTPVFAAQFGDWELSGFAKDEYALCDNCSPNLVNPSTYDPRGVLNQASIGDPKAPMINQAEPGHDRGTNLALAMLTGGYSHEFDNAISVQAKVSARWRNNGSDIYGHYLIDEYVGAAYPKFGVVDVGTLSSRSWTRADSFAYPIGFSDQWAESGAGYGIFPLGVRYGTPQYEIPLGKIYFEATYAQAPVVWPLNRLSIVNPPPKPQIVELFVQFSNERNLIEAVYQVSYGGLQNSFAEGAFTGSQGNTNAANIALGGEVPHEDVGILEGTFYMNDHWRFTYGAKRSEWSGQQQQCDFSPSKNECFWDQPGFNYASDGGMHHAIEYDGFGGIAYLRNLWTYTAGAVRLNKAYTKTPTEWGQSNTATFINLGLYRNLPEVYKHLQVYGGLLTEVFGRKGPAPLSMPNNSADGGMDPRVTHYGNALTIGANLIF